LLGRRAEAHHIFNAARFVPAAVEDDDFAGSRENAAYTLENNWDFSRVGRGGRATTRIDAMGLPFG